MLKKLGVLFSSLMIALTVMVTPIHAGTVNTSGDGYNVTFTITSTTVSGTITGKFSSGASVMVQARLMTYDGQISPIYSRTSSPYTSISLSEYPKFNGASSKYWHKGRSIGYPTSLTYGVATTWLVL